jgi:succinate dehydrogenase / fumarate reductase cytochrome b subunit
MATAQHPAAPTVRRGVQPLRAGQGTSFLWRKLHSLLGIIPLGAFLLEHLLSNFEALKGPAAYGAQVKFLNSLPLVRVLEWVFIFLPLLYHACYGVWIWLRGKSNIVYYPWAGNWLYRPALHRPDRLRLHRAARDSPALHGHQLPEHPLRGLRQGAAGAGQSLDAGRLHRGHDRHLLALLLRRLALRGQVGHHSRHDVARKRFGFVCVALGLALAIHGPGQHVGLCVGR